MRFRTLLLSAIAFLACTNLTSASDKLEIAGNPAQDHYSQRFLRIDDDGERGFVDAVKLKVYKLQLDRLKLGDDLEAVLRSPQVEKLSNFNRNRDPAKQISLVGKLSAKFGDDVVARTLVYLERNAGDNPQYLAVLKQLREEQVTEWLKKDKTISQVVTLLKFADDETVFRSNELDVLEDFIKKYNAAKRGDESLSQALTVFYSGEGRLVTMITKAKHHLRSFEKAKEVENQLLTKWKSNNVPVYAIWNRLKFGDDVNIALSKW